MDNILLKKLHVFHAKYRSIPIYMILCHIWVIFTIFHVHLNLSRREEIIVPAAPLRRDSRPGWDLRDGMICWRELLGGKLAGNLWETDWKSANGWSYMILMTLIIENSQDFFKKWATHSCVATYWAGVPHENSDASDTSQLRCPWHLRRLFVRFGTADWSARAWKMTPLVMWDFIARNRLSNM